MLFNAAVYCWTEGTVEWEVLWTWGDRSVHNFHNIYNFHFLVSKDPFINEFCCKTLLELLQIIRFTAKIMIICKWCNFLESYFLYIWLMLLINLRAKWTFEIYAQHEDFEFHRCAEPFFFFSTFSDLVMPVYIALF